MIPRIAVLLAAYNGSSYLYSQISSISVQESVSISLYLRDDGSSDNTLDIVENLKSKYGINVVETGAQTNSPAGNFFKLLSYVDLSNYDYIAFADQDDIWFPEKLISAVSTLKLNHADCYSSDLISYNNETSKAWYLKKYKANKKYDYLFQGASAGCTYVISSKAAKLVLDVLGFFADQFPKGHSHDWLIYAICRSHGLNWIHDNRAFIAYRQHNVNAFGAMPGITGLLRRFKLARCGWYREQIEWNRQFLSQTYCEMRILNAFKEFSLKDRLYLISQVSKLRRRGRDCLLLAFMLLLGLI